jgi:biotin transporter BioY
MIRFRKKVTDSVHEPPLLWETLHAGFQTTAFAALRPTDSASSQKKLLPKPKGRSAPDWQSRLISQIQKGPRLHLASVAFMVMLGILFWMSLMGHLLLPEVSRIFALGCHQLAPFDCVLNPTAYPTVPALAWHPFLVVATLALAFLGWPLGGAWILAYVILGLCGLPLFTWGGGLSYATLPGFAFWFALVCLSPWISHYSQRCFHPKQNVWGWLGQTLVSAAVTVLLVYGVALFTMFVMATTTSLDWVTLWQWHQAHWQHQALYDALGVFLAFALVLPLRMVCFLILY